MLTRRETVVGFACVLFAGRTFCIFWHKLDGKRVAICVITLSFLILISIGHPLIYVANSSIIKIGIVKCCFSDMQFNTNFTFSVSFV